MHKHYILVIREGKKHLHDIIWTEDDNWSCSFVLKMWDLHHTPGVPDYFSSAQNCNNVEEVLRELR